MSFCEHPHDPLFACGKCQELGRPYVTAEDAMRRTIDRLAALIEETQQNKEN